MKTINLEINYRFFLCEWGDVVVITYYMDGITFSCSVLIDLSQCWTFVHITIVKIEILLITSLVWNKNPAQPETSGLWEIFHGESTNFKSRSRISLRKFAGNKSKVLSSQSHNSVIEKVSVALRNSLRFGPFFLIVRCCCCCFCCLLSWD